VVVAILCALTTMPASAPAQGLSLPLPLPCVDVLVVQVNCDNKPAGPECKNTTLQPSDSNLAAIRAATLCLLNKERANHHLA
jgi:hypothetical protein